MVLFLKMAYCYRALFLHWIRCLLTTSFLEKTANKETTTDKTMSKNKSTIKRLRSIWSTKYKIMSAGVFNTILQNMAPGTNGWLIQLAFVTCSQPWMDKVKNTHAKNPPECPWNWSRWKIFWAVSGMMVKTSQKNIVKIPRKKTAAIEYPEVTPCNFSIGKKTSRKKRITDAPSVLVDPYHQGNERQRRVEDHKCQSKWEWNHVSYDHHKQDPVHVHKPSKYGSQNCSISRALVTAMIVPW